MISNISFFERMLYVIYPSRCMCCDEVIACGKYICDDCRTELTKLRSIRAKHLSYGGINMTIHSVFKYEGAAKSAISLLKFCKRANVAKPLGRAIADSILKMRDNEFDLVCFVPMTARAVRNRGYNQAGLIAKSVAKQLKINYSANTIKKLHENKLQHNLTGRDRRENVRSIFFADPFVRGKRVLVIDDVSTTGATLCECAKTLLNAGAKSVCLFSATATKYSN